MEDAIQSVFSMPVQWIVHHCAISTLYQGVYMTYPIILSSILIKLLVMLVPASERVYDMVSISLGVWTIWWYYNINIGYIAVLISFVYMLLLAVQPGKRGVVVGGSCMAFVIVCELFIASAIEWHKVRGTFIIITMKLVSLAFDLDTVLPSSKKPNPALLGQPIPSVISYICYSIFPSTTVFGPFITYNEHIRYTRRTPFSMGWCVYIVRSYTVSMLCLVLSSCVFTFLFEDRNHWNKWLTAYSAAASFRYSHYFVSLLSECSTVLSGLGYSIDSSGNISWKGFRVAYPLNVEIPRSLGSLIIYWNVPMHHFLKNYVFKPVSIYLNSAGAFFITFLTSAMLHGLNFQLAAVLFSIAFYAYVENRFRYRLSKRLNACVKDKICPSGCTHKYKSDVPWVMSINLLLTSLTIFHLAYLGVMFNNDINENVSSQEGYSMMHTLRHWYNLDFLSHYVALATLLVSFIV